MVFLLKAHTNVSPLLCCAWTTLVAHVMLTIRRPSLPSTSCPPSTSPSPPHPPPSHRSPLQKTGKRNKFVHDLVREVTGFAPYERRIVELLRIGADKRALKFSKKRVRWRSPAARGTEQMPFLSVLSAHGRALVSGRTS